MNLLITAHTGCDGTPHNSVESLLRGRGLGADFCEIDVRSTGDETPVLWHDDALETRSGERVLIGNLSLAEIRSQSRSGEILLGPDREGILTLEDILPLMGASDLLLNLDLKDDECIVPVAKLVKSWNLAERVVFSGCGKVRASYLKTNYPGFQVLLNADEAFLKRKDLAGEEIIRGVCETALSAGCCGINLRHNFYTPELQEYADRRFLPLSVWTVGPEDGYDRFIRGGVHSITTLHVEELVALRRGMA